MTTLTYPADAARQLEGKQSICSSSRGKSIQQIAVKWEMPADQSFSGLQMTSWVKFWITL